MKTLYPDISDLKEATETTLAIPFSSVPDNIYSLDSLGGKGYNLIKLYRAKLSVPNGFLIPTNAFNDHLKQKISDDETLELFIKKKLQEVDDLSTIQRIGKEIREAVCKCKVNTNLMNAVRELLAKVPKSTRYAVRSSATTEDLADLSFAGQHDTYLNIAPNEDDIVLHIQKCWASLFTDRAIMYRYQNMKSKDIPEMCVVVQEMVNAVCAGVMFTADPINHHRNTIAIDAAFGVGESVVSGLVNSDSYRIHKQTLNIISKKIAKKTVYLDTNKQNQLEKKEVDESQKEKPCLTDGQIEELAKIGRLVEELYEGKEQDIEWAIDSDGKIYLLQSRPITSLYPIPKHSVPYFLKKNPYERKDFCVYACLNHIQVMTDPILPLGATALENITGFLFGTLHNREYPTISHRTLMSSGRIYIDLTDMLKLPIMGTVFPRFIGYMADNLIGKALQNVTRRKEFIDNAPKGSSSFIFSLIKFVWFCSIRTIWWFAFANAENVTKPAFQRLNEEFNVYLKNIELAKKKDNLSAIIAAKNVQNVFYNGIFRIAPFLVTAMQYLILLKLLVPKPELLDKLLHGIELNSTLMNKGMIRIGQCAKKNPKLLKCLQYIVDHRDEFQDFDKIMQYIKTQVPKDDLKEFLTEWNTFMNEFGFRGIGEIDMTRERFLENPYFVVQVAVQEATSDHPSPILDTKQIGEEAIQEIIDSQWNADKWKWWNILSFGILGYIKHKIIKRICYLFRSAFSKREDPKAWLMKILYTMKDVCLDGCKELNERGILKQVKDGYYLYEAELIHLLSKKNDITQEEIITVQSVIEQRKADYEKFEKVQPKRVVTSEGEDILTTVQLSEIQNLKPNELMGYGVASGEVTGKARVILDPTHSTLEKGEIIVAKNIDPAFSALFANCAGMVSEVGGLMTHGSVVARELGIPAVTCVEGATTKIKTGQKIHVNGTTGLVTLIDDEE